MNVTTIDWIAILGGLTGMAYVSYFYFHKIDEEAKRQFHKLSQQDRTHKTGPYKFTRVD